MLPQDNLRFDSVWRNGKRVTVDELAAARNGAYVLWREEKTSYRSYSCSVALSDPNGSLAPAVEKMYNHKRLLSGQTHLETIL